MINYKNKYIKYKNKYINVKKQKGGDVFIHSEPEMNNENVLHTSKVINEKKKVTDKFIEYECSTNTINENDNDNEQKYRLYKCDIPNGLTTKCVENTEKTTGHEYKICDKIITAKTLGTQQTFFASLQKILMKFISILNEKAYINMRPILLLNESQYLQYLNNYLSNKLAVAAAKNADIAAAKAANKPAPIFEDVDEIGVKDITVSIPMFYERITDKTFYSKITYEMSKGKKTEMEIEEFVQIIKIIDNIDTSKKVKLYRKYTQDEILRWLYQSILSNIYKTDFKFKNIKDGSIIERIKKYYFPTKHLNVNRFVKEHIKKSDNYKNNINIFCLENELSTQNETTDIQDADFEKKTGDIILYKELNQKIFIYEETTMLSLVEKKKMDDVKIKMYGNGKMNVMKDMNLYLFNFDYHMGILNECILLIEQFISKYSSVT